MTTVSLDRKSVFGLGGKALGGGRSGTFADAPSAATAAPIVTALIAELAAVGGFKPKHVIALLTGAAPVAAPAAPAKPAKATKDSTVTADAVPVGWVKGDNVQVKFSDGKRYPAVVTKVRGDVVHFTWVDGGEKDSAPLADVSPVKAPKAPKAAPVAETKPAKAPKAAPAAEPVKGPAKPGAKAPAKPGKAA